MHCLQLQLLGRVTLTWVSVTWAPMCHVTEVCSTHAVQVLPLTILSPKLSGLRMEGKCRDQIGPLSCAFPPSPTGGGPCLRRADCIWSGHIATWPTGCSTGEIYLCQFGETKAKAGYTPMPGHLEAPAPSPQSLFTTPPKSWNPSPGVNFTHWGQPQAVN